MIDERCNGIDNYNVKRGFIMMMDEKYFSSSEVTRKLDISLRQLYYWELKGIVKPNLITLGSREFKRKTGRIFTKCFCCFFVEY